MIYILQCKAWCGRGYITETIGAFEDEDEAFMKATKLQSSLPREDVSYTVQSVEFKERQNNVD